MYLRSQVKKKDSLIIHILKDTRKHIWKRCPFTEPGTAEICTFALLLLVESTIEKSMEKQFSLPQIMES